MVLISKISWKCFPIQHWKFLVNHANSTCLTLEIASSYLLTERIYAVAISLKTYPKCLGTRFIIKPSWRFNHFPVCFPLKRNVSNNVLAACDAPSVFVPKRLWFLRCFNWQNVFPRRPPYQNSLNNGEKVSCGPLGETGFRFRLKLKYNFSGIDVSQPTPAMSLSVP